MYHHGRHGVGSGFSAVGQKPRSRAHAKDMKKVTKRTIAFRPMMDHTSWLTRRSSDENLSLVFFRLLRRMGVKAWGPRSARVSRMLGRGTRGAITQRAAHRMILVSAPT